jgi:Flp pilus assembly protein TadD
MCRDARRFEESWRGYSEALKLMPEEPGLHNDAGIVLHYYLHRDYGTAQELYERALELAEAELAATDTAPARRTEMEVVKRDASRNLEKLARGDYEWNG